MIRRSFYDKKKKYILQNNHHLYDLKPLYYKILNKQIHIMNGIVKMKIYIVDDSEIMRERLSMLILSIEGVEISGEAETEDEAIKAIMELKPDIVILDIMLKKGNGINVLRELKKQNSTSTVIMLTSYIYPQYVRKCLGLGANFIFNKNSDIEELINTLRSFKNNCLPAN